MMLSKFVHTPMLQARTLAILLGLAVISAIAPAQWKPLPTLFGGNVSGFASLGDKLFAGCDQFGLAVSADRGGSWQAVGSGFQPWQYYQLARLNDTVYALDRNRVLLASGDGGTHWDTVNALASEYGVYTIMAAYGRIFLGCSVGGIWASTNGGRRFYRQTGDLEASCFYQHDTTLFAGTNLGVYISKDRGKSWWRQYAGLPTVNGMTLVFTLAANDSLVFAGCSNPISGGSSQITVCVSRDGGYTWAPTSGVLEAWLGEPLNIVSMAVSGPNLLLATYGQGLFLSPDNGTHWRRASSGLRSAKISQLFSYGDTLLAATAGGVFASTDHGESWYQSSSGLSNVSVRALDAKGNDLIALVDGLGLYRSKDGGLAWIACDTTMPDTARFSIQTISTHDSLLVAGTSKAGMFVSSDRGLTWTQQIDSLADLDIESSTVGESNIYAGCGTGVAIMTRGSHSWRWVLTTKGMAPAVKAIAANDNLIVAATHDSVYVSADGGWQWKVGRGLISNSFVISAALLGPHIYVGTGSPGAVTSSDGGQTWIRADSGLPGGVQSLSQVGPTLAAGLYNRGVFMLNETGRSWTAANTGLTGGSVLSLAVSDGTLLAGTAAQDPHGFLPVYAGGGIWYRPVSEIISGVETGATPPEEFQLLQNYPNPFNPSTTIRYAVPRRSHVALTLFNTLGQRVTTLINGEVEAGYHTVRFDASGLANGVYFYRLQTEGFTQTKKLCVIK